MKDNRVRPYPHFKFPDEIEVTVTKMTDSNCSWHGVPIGSYELRTANYGWFPSGAVMGVVNKMFSDTHKIGAVIRGNMGSAGIAVMNVERAIELLNEAGYKKITRL